MSAIKRILAVILFSAAVVVGSVPRATAQTVEATEGASLDYEIADGRVTFFFEGLSSSDIRDILWDGRSIYAGVAGEQIGRINYSEAGFSVAFNKRLSLKGPGVLEVVLFNGAKLQKALFTGPLPSVDWITEMTSCTDAPAIYKAVQCGSVKSDAGTPPYPCCDNTGNGKATDAGDGNCTWFVWYRASKIKQWTVPSTWGGADKWCKNASATKGWKISSIPAVNTIACGLTIGHVAWVTAVSSDKKTFTVEEQDCRVAPSCFGSDRRTKTYNTSSFNFISKI